MFQRGVYPLRVFQSFEGIGKRARPRNVTELAPNCLKFIGDALAEHPQPTPSTHAVCLFFGHGILGLTGSGEKRGK